MGCLHYVDYRSKVEPLKMQIFFSVLQKALAQNNNRRSVNQPLKLNTARCFTLTGRKNNHKYYTKMKKTFLGKTLQLILTQKKSFTSLPPSPCSLRLERRHALVFILVDMFDTTCISNLKSQEVNSYPLNLTFFPFYKD